MAAAAQPRAALPWRLTVSSSFSMPVGICGTVLLIALNSAKSGISSCIYTGMGLEASSCLARNLLMLAAQILAAPHYTKHFITHFTGGLAGRSPPQNVGGTT